MQSHGWPVGEGDTASQWGTGQCLPVGDGALPASAGGGHCQPVGDGQCEPVGDFGIQIRDTRKRMFDAKMVLYRLRFPQKESKVGGSVQH